MEELYRHALGAAVTAVGALLLGLWRNMSSRLDQVDRDQSQQNERLAKVEAQIDNQAERFERIDSKLDKHDEKLDRLIQLVARGNP